MEIDLRQVDVKSTYALLIGAVAPRPIALITSVNPDGGVNAAPFSFYNVVCTDPPMVAVSVMRRRGVRKDTAENIAATGEFVVNAVDRDLAEDANACSADYPPGISEVEHLHLPVTPSRFVRPPGLLRAKIRLECRLVHMLPLGNGPNADLIIGEVLSLFVRDDLYRDGKIDLYKYRPVGRLAGDDYCETLQVFSLPRPGKPGG